MSSAMRQVGSVKRNSVITTAKTILSHSAILRHGAHDSCSAHDLKNPVVDVNVRLYSGSGSTVSSVACAALALSNGALTNVAYFVQRVSLHRIRPH